MAMNPIETKPTLPISNEEQERITHLKPQVDPATISWRNLRRDAFWQ